MNGYSSWCKITLPSTAVFNYSKRHNKEAKRGAVVYVLASEERKKALNHQRGVKVNFCFLPKAKGVACNVNFVLH